MYFCDKGYVKQSFLVFHLIVKAVIDFLAMSLNYLVGYLSANI